MLYRQLFLVVVISLSLGCDEVVEYDPSSIDLKGYYNNPQYEYELDEVVQVSDLLPMLSLSLNSYWSYYRIGEELRHVTVRSFNGDTIEFQLDSTRVLTILEQGFYSKTKSASISDSYTSWSSWDSLIVIKDLPLLHRSQVIDNPYTSPHILMDDSSICVGTYREETIYSSKYGVIQHLDSRNRYEILAHSSRDSIPEYVQASNEFIVKSHIWFIQ